MRRFLQQEDSNFLLTNRVPRLLLTRLMGRFSRIRNPWLARCSIAAWRLLTKLDLSDAQQQRFASLHDCFMRELRPGARPVEADPQVLASPCDAIVGACGSVDGTVVFQAKGFLFRLQELFGPTQDSTPFHHGSYVTLRLTSAMYHPLPCTARRAAGACQLPQWRHLERQSDCAGPRGAVVLPQRASGAAAALGAG